VLLLIIGTTNHGSRTYGSFHLFAGIKQSHNSPASLLRTEEKRTSPTIEIENEETAIATVDTPSPEQPEQVSSNSSAEDVPSTEPILEPIFVKDSVYFASSRAELNQTTRNTLLKLLAVMNENPEAAISITGHCALAGTERGRNKLSHIRAKRVYEFLRSNGLMSDSEPAIIGMGSKALVTADPGQQHLNRRVEIVIGHEAHE
jgi:outer membrane protein OmpA-like peptidoglycan-associated protein